MTTLKSSQSKRTTKGAVIARIGAGLALAALSAGMLTLAFPPHNLWPLIGVAFVPMLLAQYRVMPRRWSSLAPAVAIGGWMGLFFTQVFGLGGGGAWYMRSLPLLIGGFTLLTEQGNRPLHERTGYRWFVLHGVVGWVGFEMIRGFIPFMGTWAFVGHPLWNQPWLIQPISIFGIYGLDLLIMLLNFVLAQVAFVLFDRKWRWDDAPAVDSRANKRWLGGICIALVVWTGLSLGLFFSAPDAAPTVRVAAVQPGITWPAHIDQDTPPEVRLQTLAAQTREAAQRGAQIVVWPELGVGFDPQAEHTTELRALAAETETYLVIGYGLETEQGFRNEATVLTPSGEFLGIYGKAHPTAFGGEPRGINAGTYPVYDTPLGVLATMICYDIDFTDVSRIMAGQGAQLIAAPSHDGPTIAEKHYTHLVFRAIENRVAMVKSDAAWDSAIVDPYGRIREWTVTPEGSQATLVADVPLGTADSLYVKLGDWVGWLCLAGFAFFIVFTPVIKRRAQAQ
jgi:apolipoprotein N-acyltransferase